METAAGMGELEAIRRALRGREAGAGRRYAPELQRRIVRWAELRRDGGTSVEGLAAALGIRVDTLRRWLGSRSTRALIPVHVVSEPTQPLTLTLISPSGFRVEGLGVTQTAALLRELG